MQTVREIIRLCAFFSTGRKHRGCCGKSRLGKSRTMSIIFLPTQPFPKQRINPGVCKVVGLEQSYYGSRGDEGPRMSSCAAQGLEAGDSGLCCSWQERCSSLLRLCSSVGRQFFGDISDPTILPDLWVLCFQTVVGESCGYPGGISGAKRPVCMDFSLDAKREMSMWKETAGLRGTGDRLPSIACNTSSWLFNCTANLLAPDLNCAPEVLLFYKVWTEHPVSQRDLPVWLALAKSSAGPPR